jgi:hypothetical protein
MATEDPPTFEELTELLRVRLNDADALTPGGLHSFRELMADYSEVIPDAWYWDAFDELEAQGHLDPHSVRGNNHNAFGRLSADGRLYLRQAENGDA